MSVPADLNSLTLLIIGALAVLLLLLAVFWLVQRRRKAKAARKRANGRAGSTRRDAVRSKRLEEDKMREIYKDLATMTSTLNYQRVLDIALDLSMQALGDAGQPAPKLISAVLLFSNTREAGKEPELYVGAARRFIRADMSATFPAEQGILREAIDEGAAILSYDIANDPELGRTVTFRQCKSAYCIPLRTGLDVYGAMIFAHPDPKFFTVPHREMLDIIGNQAMIAIQNARLYQDLEQEKERMMEIQEEARKKLARDLHDGPTQSIAAIAMRVNFARRLMERDANAAADELQKIEDLARRTTKEIRHMLFTLRPLVLESQGLTAALESMAEKMKETYDQTVLVSVDPDLVSELEMGKQGVIFYIADEAVTNARKHANADHIWVRLKPVEKDLALLEIADDGDGFDVEAVNASYEHRGSLGMVNLRERSELLNGVLQLDSVRGQGTRVRVYIPLTEEAADRLHRGV